MLYPFITIGLLVAFIGYLLYVLLIKKDRAKLKTVLFPGIFFIGVWVVMYYMIVEVL